MSEGNSWKETEEGKEYNRKLAREFYRNNKELVKERIAQRKMARESGLVNNSWPDYTDFSPDEIEPVSGFQFFTENS